VINAKPPVAAVTIASSYTGSLAGPCGGNPTELQRFPNSCGPYDAVMGGPCVRNVKTGRFWLTASSNAIAYGPSD
jgi:hypothetical protein